MAEQATGAAFAATWRNQEGDVVGTAFGGTMCWMPRKPWTLRIVREGYAHIVRCGECPGCLEFERRRLAARLVAQYGKKDIRPQLRKVRSSLAQHEKDRQVSELQSVRPARGAAGKLSRRVHGLPALYLIRIYAPKDEVAALSHKLHRRRRLELEPGYWRLGADSFAVLSRTRVLPPLYLRGAPLRIRVEPILLRRGKRAWRSLTGGILVARAVYGEQTNRWYCRGLPKAEREQWEVDRHAGIKGYSRATSPRAWKAQTLYLVPPEVWRLGRADRRSLRRDFSAAVNPEGVARVMELVGRALAKRDVSSVIGPAVRPLLTSDQVKQWYADMARRKAARTESERTDPSSSPSSGEGGYVSSGHSSGNDPPRSTAGERLREGFEPWTPIHLPKLPEDSLTELTHKQWLHRKTRRELDQHLEELRIKIKERGRGDA